VDEKLNLSSDFFSVAKACRFLWFVEKGENQGAEVPAKNMKT